MYIYVKAASIGYFPKLQNRPPLYLKYQPVSLPCNEIIV